MTPAQLDNLLDRVIAREGGYVNHPDDPGGETKFGISKRRYPGEKIADLTIERAKELYLRDFVVPLKLDMIEHERLAELLFDWFVNGGPAVKAIQRLVGVQADGVVGKETITAINTHSNPDKLCQEFLYSRLFYFVSLTKHPFIKGWVRRLVDLGL